MISSCDSSVLLFGVFSAQGMDGLRVGYLGCPGQGQGLDSDPDGSLPAQPVL